MTATNSQELIEQEYREFLDDKSFPCVGAKAALSRNQIKSIVVPHMACPSHDTEIVKFMYEYVDQYRASKELYHSAAVIFLGPLGVDENHFDALLWQRLQSLSTLDKRNFQHDSRVDSDPASARYSFSLKGEAFFIVGLHPASSRRARQFKYPTLVFNPHDQFEKLRAANRFVKMRNVVRKRDVAYSGSINPMLDDFSQTSEVYQYSGRQYPSDWTCPLSK